MTLTNLPNSQVEIVTWNRRREAGAVVRGATERLVPILMTALAAGLALVPIALSAGEPGSEIQAPMAMVIMFGLLSSTALNMIVVPILYERFGRPVISRLGSASA